jgi:putative copper export protein
MLLSKLVLVNHWLHLSAAALLIGGMVFLIAILRPVLGRNSSVSGIGILANDVHARFRIYVGMLIGVIIVTGVINSIDGITSVAETGISSGFKIAMRIKVVLAICLFIIYGVNAFLIREEKTDEDCSCLIVPPLHKRVLQVIALVLVFTIFFLAVTLRFL